MEIRCAGISSLSVFFFPFPSKKNKTKKQKPVALTTASLDLLSINLHMRLCSRIQKIKNVPSNVCD